MNLPERIDRERYFRELSYLEMSELFTGPLKPAHLEKWKSAAPAGALGLVAPWVVTHRVAPKANRLWDHVPPVGEFRDSASARDALTALHLASESVAAACVVFQSPPLFAPSAANREALQRFFGERATPEILGLPAVWVPDGLWDTRAAISFATELGVACAFDPLVREPGEPPEIYYDLEVPALYLRIVGLGRSGAIRSERQEDLAMLIEHYKDLSVIVAFDSPQRWQDARNLHKLLKDV